MSAWEDVPVEETALDGWTEDEVEQWLRSVFDDLAGYTDELKGHDQDGFLAREAGSKECLALGHKPNEYGEWNSEDGIHESGFEGDLLCTATEYDTCCTYCEGECSAERPPSLWDLPGVNGKHRHGSGND